MPWVLGTTLNTTFFPFVVSACHAFTARAITRGNCSCLIQEKDAALCVPWKFGGGGPTIELAIDFLWSKSAESARNLTVYFASRGIDQSIDSFCHSSNLPLNYTIWAISRYRQNAFASSIWRGVLHSTSNSAGLATSTVKHCARDVATLSRLAL